MTIADLLFQASLWQWIGILLLAAIIFGSLSQMRLVVMTRKVNSDNADDHSQHKGASHWDHVK